MKATIDRRRIVCEGCGTHAEINWLTLLYSDSSSHRWMGLPVGWFTSPSFEYLCTECALRMCTEPQKLPIETSVLEYLTRIDEKLDVLTSIMKEGNAVKEIGAL